MAIEGSVCLLHFVLHCVTLVRAQKNYGYGTWSLTDAPLGYYASVAISADFQLLFAAQENTGAQVYTNAVRQGHDNL
jgi:hypothetical protein